MPSFIFPPGLPSKTNNNHISIIKDAFERLYFVNCRHAQLYIPPAPHHRSSLVGRQAMWSHFALHYFHIRQAAGGIMVQWWLDLRCYWWTIISTEGTLYLTPPAQLQKVFLSPGTCLGLIINFPNIGGELS